MKSSEFLISFILLAIGTGVVAAPPGIPEGWCCRAGEVITAPFRACQAEGGAPFPTAEEAHHYCAGRGRGVRGETEQVGRPLEAIPITLPEDEQPPPRAEPRGRQNVPPVDPVDARDAYAGPAYSDKLLALFLKLSINDPNNPLETHKMLQKIESDLREQMLDAARQKEREREALEAEAGRMAAASRTLLMVVNAHVAAQKSLTEQERLLIRLRIGEELTFGVIARLLHLSGAEEAEKRFEEAWAKYFNLTKQFIARMAGMPDLWDRECSPPACLVNHPGIPGDSKL